MKLEIEISGGILSNTAEDMQKRIDKAQILLTTECKKAADVFTPMEYGNLKNNFKYTMNEHGAIDGWRYKEEYAHRQWDGRKKDGSPFSYSLAVNDKARSRWTSHAASNFGDEIARAVLAEFIK